MPSHTEEERKKNKKRTPEEIEAARAAGQSFVRDREKRASKLIQTGLSVKSAQEQATRDWYDPKFIGPFPPHKKRRHRTNKTEFSSHAPGN